MNKLFIIKYPGSWMGGNAVVIATNEQEAWGMLKENNDTMDPFNECKFTECPFNPGVIYNWDGEY